MGETCTQRDARTLCWDCKNAILGCSWAREFVPVPGWKAVPRKLRHNAGLWSDTFQVVECPEFVRDATRGGTERWPPRKNQEVMIL